MQKGNAKMKVKCRRAMQGGEEVAAAVLPVLQSSIMCFPERELSIR